MESGLNNKIDSYKVAFLLLALLFCTYARVALLIVYPAVVVFLFYICSWKLNRNALYIYAIVAICWLISFRNGIYIRYNLVSFYYYLSFFLLLFAAPAPKATHPNFLKLFMGALTIIALINDVTGILQYILHPNDDSFVGIFGRFTVSQNGLSIINAILFFYYFVKFRYDMGYKYLALSVFFIVCCVLGFYGAGLLVLIVTLVLTYLKTRKKNLAQLLVVSAAFLGILVLLMRIISPDTLEYNINIIRKFMNPSGPGAPRKLMVFQNYLTGYSGSVPDLLFGSGPGTFNSRSAFIVGSPTYFNFDFIKSHDKPFYFNYYAYPLWNETNTGPFDGFMNQPFTSILSLLGEYGLLLTITLFGLLLNRFYYFNKVGNEIAKDARVSIEAKMYRFCAIYTLLLIIIDNYIEYPEITGLLLIIIKMSQQEISKGKIFTLKNA